MELRDECDKGPLLASGINLFVNGLNGHLSLPFFIGKIFNCIRFVKMYIHQHFWDVISFPLVTEKISRY